MPAIVASTAPPELGEARSPLLVRLCVMVLAPVAVAVIVTCQSQAQWLGTSEAMRRSISATVPSTIAAYSETELVGLPAPVARYFRSVLRDGQAIIRQADVTWSGQFNMGKAGRDRWVPFTATQLFVPGTREFVWDARMALAPGLPVLVSDSFIDGTGAMHAAIFGLIRLVDVAGTADLARGELLRFLGEAVWLPTALLPSQGVHWSPIDDNSARATISGGGVAVSAEYRFADDGSIASLSSKERLFDDGESPPSIHPWGGTYRRYEERNGVRVPMESEVHWDLPGGRFTYWRGTPTQIAYR
ncbi:MAG: DUF6544 family protein [Betaproteobacteria bacterium]